MAWEPEEHKDKAKKHEKGLQPEIGARRAPRLQVSDKGFQYLCWKGCTNKATAVAALMHDNSDKL